MDTNRVVSQQQAGQAVAGLERHWTELLVIN